MNIVNPKTVLTGALILALSACSDNDNDDAVMDSSRSYRISITNLTHAQPLSPPLALLHDSSLSLWKIGSSASVALEMMAEGGDGSALLALAPGNPQHQATAALAPAASTEFTLTTTASAQHQLSVAGMLVNTNDGFSGINGIELDSLTPGHTLIFYSHVYDAGSEMNSELAGTIPGPADGGTGFDAARDDVTSVVTLHGGVVSADDGLTTSTLSAADRFDHPALRIEVTAL